MGGSQGMSVQQIIVYVIAAVLVIVALARQARRIKGNVVQMRDNAGTINQTYTEASSADKAGPDRVAWAIGIIGVLVAVAQLAHDVFWPK
jgi:hypothetical protein